MSAPLSASSVPAGLSLGAAILDNCRAVVAGAAYAATAFAVGVAIAIPRELFLAPRITSDLAIVVEAPLMALIVFHLARWAARVTKTPARTSPRVVMGLVALALLVFAENFTSQAIRGDSILHQWGLYGWLAAGATYVSLIWFTAAPFAAKSNEVKTGRRAR